MTFGNNDGWHDDTSDGPVSATVTLIGGRSIPVESAWVVVTPPNYGPDIISVLTMYDVMIDTFTQQSPTTNAAPKSSMGMWLPAAKRTSFQAHIYPLLEQFCMAQWVNKGFFAQFGFGGPNHFLRPDMLAKLSSPDRVYRELRRQIFNAFRPPNTTVADINAWPWMYGDGMAVTDPPANAFLWVTNLLSDHLRSWADGDFEADLDPAALQVRPLDSVPVADQPETLDEAAMTFCLGGPFHPGCELTWPMRQISMYSNAFRVRRRSAPDPEPDYGDTLTPAVCLGLSGPLYANGPGDLTRWMAVPGQTDTASCRSGYETDYDPSIPTFWAARVPNQVLSTRDYDLIMADAPNADKQRAFNHRVTWYRFLGDTYLEQINHMTTDFGELGVVERRPGPVGVPGIRRSCLSRLSPTPPTSPSAVGSAPGRRCLMIGGLRSARWIAPWARRGGAEGRRPRRRSCGIGRRARSGPQRCRRRGAGARRGGGLQDRRGPAAGRPTPALPARAVACVL
ncbi:MAG: hypothetical protein ACI8RZ_003234 [Myxococcota bacterium]